VTRFALLFSLLAVGALGAVACDDDESATAETEVITSDFGQERGRVVVAGGADACGDYRKGPGAMVVRIEVFEGVVRCRVARRVLKTQYRNGSQDDAMQAALPWSCGRAEDLIVCHNYSGAVPKEIRARFPRQ
jgi:hypothetical protein